MRRATRRVTPFEDAGERERAAGLGMWIFLAVVGVLFGSGIVAFAAVRVHYRSQWPGGLGLPAGLWLSTGLLALGSLGLLEAQSSAARDRRRAVGVWMAVSVATGLGFCASQTMCFVQWMEQLERTAWSGEVQRAALSAFGVLTGLHAAHVIVGIVPMGLVMYRGLRGRYTQERHGAVRWCGLYWHFLGAMWVLVLATLLFLR